MLWWSSVGFVVALWRQDSHCVDKDCDDFLPWLEQKAGVEISSVLSIGKSTYGRLSTSLATNVSSTICMLTHLCITCFTMHETTIYLHTKLPYISIFLFGQTLYLKRILKIMDISILIANPNKKTKAFLKLNWLFMPCKMLSNSLSSAVPLLWYSNHAHNWRLKWILKSQIKLHQLYCFLVIQNALTGMVFMRCYGNLFIHQRAEILWRLWVLCWTNWGCLHW